jgi:hypothetical protein
MTLCIKFCLKIDSWKGMLSQMEEAGHFFSLKYLPGTETCIYLPHQPQGRMAGVDFIEVGYLATRTNKCDQESIPSPSFKTVCKYSGNRWWGAGEARRLSISETAQHRLSYLRPSQETLL